MAGRRKRQATHWASIPAPKVEAMPIRMSYCMDVRHGLRMMATKRYHTPDPVAHLKTRKNAPS
ncbi:hypothetical protein GCM10007866_16760 [Gluconobacter albidus]|uniref:Uncharacterized protein n=1 Tax=Gluconobacter albidus TaxID=318683 RepID=A0ABQ5X0A8_9PROT|nr:hypothetical protein AA3250_1151 [Gluconobacter albidus NBRC 3250]GLQ69225.1 hypothetical protein GCM10007866_16760 [Gluconobacter albidus]